MYLKYEVFTVENISLSPLGCNDMCLVREVTMSLKNYQNVV